MPFYSNLSPGYYRRMQYSDYVRHRSHRLQRQYIVDYTRIQREHTDHNEISFKNLFNTTKVKINTSDIFCPICQSNIQKYTEIVRELCCSHVYHLNCIDSWFLLKNECPLCKKIV